MSLVQLTCHHSGTFRVTAVFGGTYVEPNLGNGFHSAPPRVWFFCLPAQQPAKAGRGSSKKTEELKVIAERPPIQFVGTFPDNMRSIVKLANDTKVKLLIVGDYCAYGHYSNPDGYAEYIRALESLADKNVSVDMYLYDDETTRRTLISQFTTDFKKIENSQKFKHYFDDVHHNDLRRPRSLNEFESVMNAQQKKCVDDLSAKGVSIHRTVSNTLPLFIWLRDGDEAVFSVYNLGDNAREVSIATKDKTLVNLLEEIYTQAVRRSSALVTGSTRHP